MARARARALGLLAALALLGAQAPRPPAAASAEPPQQPILRVEAGAHTAPVSRLATDAAGRLLASVSDDKTLRLWALPDGTPLGVLRPPIGPGHEGELYAVALSPDGARAYAAGHTGQSWDGSFALHVFDTAQGRAIARLGGLPAPVQHLAVSPDGARLAVALGGRAGLRLYDARSGRPLAEDSQGWQGAVRMAVFAPDGRLAATGADGRLRVYAADGRRLAERAPQPAAGRPYGLAWSPDGTLLALGFEDRLRVELLAAADLRVVATPDTSGLAGEGLPLVTWAADGRGGVQLFAAGYARAPTPRPGVPPFVIRRWADFGLGPARDIPAARDAIPHLLALPGGGLAFAAADPGWGRITPEGTLAHPPAPPGADFRATGPRLALSPDGQRVLFALAPAGASLVFDAQAGRLSEGEEPGFAGPRHAAPRLAVTDWQNRDRPRLNGQPLPWSAGEFARSLAILPDGERFLIGGDNGLGLYDRAGRLLDRLALPGAVWGVVAGERVAVAALGDGTLRWIGLDGSRLAERGALFVHADARRWVMFTPEGLFDHAPLGGQELVGVHLNQGRAQTPEWASFQQAYRALYAPAAVRARLAGDPGPAQARMAELGEVRARIGRLPTITPGEACALIGGHCAPLGWGAAELPAGATALRLTFEAADRGLGLGPLDVMVNGRIAVRATPTPGRTEVEVPLDPGPNRVAARLYADDRALFAEAPGLELRRPGEPAAPEGAGRLILVAVGVNRHVQRDLDLRFAVADARTVSEVLTQRAGGVFREVVSTLLTDADATRANLLAALNAAAQLARPEDTFVLYLAGHGIRTEPDRRFLFLPHEADPTDMASLRRTALDEGALVAALARIRARDGFLFVDTCHAGQVTIDSLAALGNETGRFLLAASTSVQEALDSYDDRNGVFAFAVKEGLAGRAAMDGEGRVSALALGEWVTRRVPQLAAERRHRQDAVFRTAQRDLRSFPLGANPRPR